MEVPWIFLSHSGKQKEFTRSLYHELQCAGHHPFFDQDAERSLPKGHPFPTRIINACRGCKMGIVVLSDDYMISKWPMVELEQFCSHNPSIFIYPLFYKLQPADLSSPEKLSEWQRQWDSNAFKCSSWPAAVKRLRSQNGQVLPDGMEDDAWIQIIVSNICKTLPPPQCYSLSHHIKGGDGLQSEIDQIFHELPIEANGVIPLGVHGKGGSGKTTLCMTMANFYNKDFPGRSIWLEFPCDEEDEQQLLDAMKNTLSILLHIKEEDLKRICSIEEAMGGLEEVLKRHRVFLAIDNVWHWNLEYARQIIKTKYIEGSKVIVASRSEKLLQQCLPPRNVVHVPTISKAEAMEALLSYSNEGSVSHVISAEDLTSLAESCFDVEEQCHPFFLKVIGAGLGQVAGGHMDHTFVDWKSFTSSYLEACGLHALDDILQLLTGLGALFVVRHLPGFEQFGNDVDELQIELQDLWRSAHVEIEDRLDQLECKIEPDFDELETLLSSLFDE